MAVGCRLSLAVGVVAPTRLISALCLQCQADRSKKYNGLSDLLCPSLSCSKTGKPPDGIIWRTAERMAWRGMMTFSPQGGPIVRREFCPNPRPKMSRLGLISLKEKRRLLAFIYFHNKTINHR